MRFLTRSIVPSVAALAALVAFFPRSGPTITVVARDFSFRPPSLTVRVGDSVAVENAGRSTHTFTCAGCGVDTGNVQPGQEKVVRFSRPGSFTFRCIYHAEGGMGGRVVVLREGESSPSPSPSPTQAVPPVNG